MGSTKTSSICLRPASVYPQKASLMCFMKLTYCTVFASVHFGHCARSHPDLLQLLPEVPLQIFVSSQERSEGVYGHALRWSSPPPDLLHRYLVSL